MCLQDVKLGERRYWRRTPVITSTVAFTGDARRVGIRLVINSTLAAETIAVLVLAGDNVGVPVMFVNQGNPVDEMWLDTHGKIVQQPFSVNSSGNAMVVEILDNDPDAPTD